MRFTLILYGAYFTTFIYYIINFCLILINLNYIDLINNNK